MAKKIDQINSIEGFPVGLKNTPPNYPTRPSPNKISLLWKFNKHDIWHKFSPYTNGDNIFGVFPNKQPFIYRYPDQTKDSFFDKLPTSVKTLASAGNLTKGTIDDLRRISKFTLSPSGILFNITQLAIQRLNSFDETRIYNPFSPILAAASQMTFGLGNRPVRHIVGEGLLGIGLGLANSFTSTVGIQIGLPNTAPRSTVGDAALPELNVGQGKGLIRGATANLALSTLKSKWQVSKGAAPDPLSGFTSMVVNAAKSIFGNAPKSIGKYRADEETYILMANNRSKFKFYNSIGAESSYFQNWFAGSTLYKNVYGKDQDSEQLFRFRDWNKDSTRKESKFNEPVSPTTQLLSEQLKKTLAGLNKNNNYYVLSDTYSRLISTGDVKSISYDAKFKDITPNQPRNDRGVIVNYRNADGPKLIDNSFSTANLRIATTFTSDGINQLGVLNGDRKIPSTTALAATYPNWKEYKPYDDDLIAFFFYDVVNNKYIPFRATVKGLSEGNTAFWDELRFIGRADQLYSYNGFSRTLGFSFNIVINSVVELLPTWQKINYIASSVKPSNYTIGEKSGGVFNRFIVPPMFMLTIGDLYKFQPIIITSINVNLPDDASWETLNESNSDRWSYLTNLIQSPNVGKLYGQLPKEAEIAVTCNLLEKERSIVGGSHYGHAPRKDDWENREGNSKFITGNKNYLPGISQFHSSSVVFNNPSVNPFEERFDSEANLVTP